MGLLLLAAPLVAGRLKVPPAEEVTNFSLSPSYSTWLVGPLSQVATAEETASYLALRSDEEAASFIESFWERRGGSKVFPKKSPRVLYDERAEEADRLFSEAAHLGRRTDRGTVYVLYGPPEENSYESAPPPRRLIVEIWRYPKGADDGLDGRKPERTYAFAKTGSVTEFYLGPIEHRRAVAPQGR